MLYETGKVRLAKWFQTMPQKAKAKIVKDVTQLVLARRTRMCNFLEYKGAQWLLFLLLTLITMLSMPYRYQSRLQAICLALLRLRYQLRR